MKQTNKKEILKKEHRFDSTQLVFSPCIHLNCSILLTFLACFQNNKSTTFGVGRCGRALARVCDSVVMK